MAIQHCCLKLKFKQKVAVPQLWGKKGCQFFTLVNNNISLMSHFVRIASGHTPIGSFQQCFFPDSNYDCPCGGSLQDTKHISILCPKYNAKFTSFVQFLFSPNKTKKIFLFLKQNTTPVSFEDQPLDLDCSP